MTRFGTDYFWMKGGDAAVIIERMIHDPILSQFFFDIHPCSIEPPQISVPYFEGSMPRGTYFQDPPAPLNSDKVDLQRIVEPLTYDTGSEIHISIHLTSPEKLTHSFNIPDATLQKYGAPGIEIAIHGRPNWTYEDGSRGYQCAAGGGFYTCAWELKTAMGSFKEKIKPRLVRAFPKKSLPKPRLV